MQTELYFLRSSEQSIAKELLYYAARLDQSKQSLDEFPELEQYVRNFGTYSGDIGVYMMAGGKVAGAAWVRLLANGFGHIDHDTPELILAVKPEFRNQGLGSSIMEQLFIEVSKVFSQMSLSVREDNPVISLYERLGFEKVQGSEHPNPAGTHSFKMLKTFEQREEEKEVKHLEEECFRKSFRQRG